MYNSREVFPMEKASGLTSLYILKYSPTGLEFSGEKINFPATFPSIKVAIPNEFLDIQMIFVPFQKGGQGSPHASRGITFSTFRKKFN